jgi:hypothetical protein
MIFYHPISPSPYLAIFLLGRANFFMDATSFFRDSYNFMDVPRAPMKTGEVL